MRSGTTHLHNLLAASGQFATVPPVLAGCHGRRSASPASFVHSWSSICPKTG
jgi:hypothetical protein